jgi:Na+-driven multidrug efflux pump
MIGYFQSIKRGTWATIFTALRGYLFIALCFVVLPQLWGVPGAWLAIPAAEALTTLSILLFTLGRLGCKFSN